MTLVIHLLLTKNLIPFNKPFLTGKELPYIDEAIRLLMREDQENLAAVSARANEPEISYEDLLNDLKSHGKI